MQFIIYREILLKSLQQLCNLISSRPLLPILSHLLLAVKQETLYLTSSDLEIEMTAYFPVHVIKEGTTTVSARKFFDICRALPENAEVEITQQADKLNLRTESSSFSLATLAAEDYPHMNEWPVKESLTLKKSELKRLIEVTHFAMANQDIRPFLNGLLLETKQQQLSTVATDGHRLAICTLMRDNPLPNHAMILPRKGVIELLRLLEIVRPTKSGEESRIVKLDIGDANIKVALEHFVFTTKLVGRNFPDYQRVLANHPNKTLLIDCDILKQACIRVSILVNEKFRGVRMQLGNHQLKMSVTNPEQEEAQEQLGVEYHGESLDIRFNVKYLIDVLNVIKEGPIKVQFTDANSSVQITSALENKQDSHYIIMPMRI